MKYVNNKSQYNRILNCDLSVETNLGALIYFSVCPYCILDDTEIILLCSKLKQTFVRVLYITCVLIFMPYLIFLKRVFVNLAKPTN